ncbi:MAG: MATE family efflux transporter [Idiomarina sp.]|nr:MATE family efflux transporter [Idiomarina sp.]
MTIKFRSAKPVSAHRIVFAIALPMVISNIAAPLLGLVDTAIIGHLPDAIYLSAVAIGAMAVSFLYLLAIFLRMATTGLVAQAYGARNREKQQQHFMDGAMLALGLGVVILLATPLILRVLWSVVEADTALQSLASDYVRIRLFGAPAALLTLVVLGVLLGAQRAKQAMLLAIITNGINVILDVILIIGLDMNVRGAAIASLVAEWVTAGIGVYWVIDYLKLRWRELPRLNAARAKHLFGLNRDIFARSLMLNACLAMMTAGASYYGATVVAANAVLLQFLMLISLGLDGLAYAVEALIGEAKGRNSGRRMRLWFRLCLFWSTLFALAYALLFWVFGNQIIGLITNIPEVIFEAQRYLPWLIVMPLLAHWSYLFDGVFIGLSASRAMRNTMAIAALGVFVPLWWLTREFENHGLWFALACFMLARGAAQAWVMRRDNLLVISARYAQSS